MAWIGLYYPRFRVRDERWLKLTALYWDRLYSLWPNRQVEIGRTQQDLKDSGFIRTMTPSFSSCDRAALEFAQVAIALDPVAFRVSSDPRHTVELEHLDNVKMAGRLVEQMIQMGLAVHSDRYGVWMHPTLARVYLLLLGRYVAAECGACTLTDDETEHAAARVEAGRLLEGVLLEQPAQVSPQREQAALLVDLAVTTVIPRDLEEVPSSKILAFRERYAGERARFQEAVATLAKEIAELDGVRDHEMLLDHLRAHFETRIQPGLNDLKRALRGLGMEAAWGAMNVQVSAPVAVAGGLAAYALHPSASQAAVLGTGGLALGLWRTYQQRSQRRAETLAASQFAYLYRLETDLAPIALAERLRDALARFTPGAA